jgi:hypothetical protein
VADKPNEQAASRRHRVRPPVRAFFIQVSYILHQSNTLTTLYALPCLRGRSMMVWELIIVLTFKNNFWVNWYRCV